MNHYVTISKFYMDFRISFLLLFCTTNSLFVFKFRLCCFPLIILAHQSWL